jgi:hypothetical protein
MGHIDYLGAGAMAGERKRGWLGGILLGIILLGWNFINVTTYPFPRLFR